MPYLPPGESEVKMLMTQLCPTLCDPMDCSPPGCSVHGILQARILEWVAMPSLRGPSWPRNWTWVSCFTGRFFTIWTTRNPSEPLSQAKTNRSIINCCDSHCFGALFLLCWEFCPSTLWNKTLPVWVSACPWIPFFGFKDKSSDSHVNQKGACCS